LNSVSLALSKRFTSRNITETGDIALVDEVRTRVVAREHIVPEIQTICNTENNP
jgi:hypothetical protein